MIKKGISVKKCNKKKQVLYRILMGSHGAEFLSWDLVKVAKLGHRLISFHVCSVSDSALKGKSAIKDYSKFGRDFYILQKVNLKGSISRGSSIKKVLNSAANRENTLGSWISFARCCANQLPHNERILSTKRSVFQLRGFRLNSKPEFYLNEKSTRLEYAEEQVVEGTESHAILSSEHVLTDGSEDLNDHNSTLNHDYTENVSLSSISLIREVLPESTLGWPLLRKSITPPSNEVLSRLAERDMSVVEWVMSLPCGSTSVVNQEQMVNTSLDREIDKFSLKDNKNEGNIQLGIRAVEDEPTDGRRNSKDETLSLVPGHKAEVSSSSISLLTEKLSQSKPGWPLLRISAPLTVDNSGESEDRTSPNRSTPATPQTQISLVSDNIENSFQKEISYSKDDGDENPLTSSTKLSKESELSFKLSLSNCKRFSYSELKTATCQFSSDNLIGEGGCSKVYEGCLASAKPVAVKVLKSYKEAWNDFSLEVEIISSLKHKYITPLIGVCIEDNNLILVYDFLPKGSLDESLHGNGKKSVLPWEVRFKVAVATAEALNYLHNECLRPVIHRDVKSSNILLSNEFQPQLSDFGLAIWGPTDSTCMILEDAVGTFGYIAPEYFMHGRVSDKVDVYSFGVVLLELLSGRRPIGSKNLKGQESLVKWAKPIIESGDVEALLDPNLVGDYDIAQMRRMVLVANLCINQSSRLRPKVNQILELLRGEKDAKELVSLHVDDVKGTDNQEDDDHLLEYGGKSYLDFSFLDTDDGASVSSVDGISLCCAERKQQFKLNDYLKVPQD